jgi:Fe-Mn family superoxide dismutase
MTFTLPQLPYAMDALAPHISEETLEYHYGKHHQAYVNNLNKLLSEADDSLKSMSLEELILNSKGGIFNNAAQVWNHTFYWDSLSPNGGGEPNGKIAELIKRDFGSLTAFKEQFTQTAIATFGSGWAWLVQNGSDKLKIVSTSNAGNPLTDSLKPLLTCDVWEHAYYIDYRNARPEYLNHFWDLVDWEFAEQNLK